MPVRRQGMRRIECATWPGQRYHVVEQPPAVEAIIRRIIEECRRDIEAARLHIEAMRAILSKSRRLVATWDERRQADAATGGLRLPAYDTMRESGFVDVEDARNLRKRRRRQAR